MEKGEDNELHKHQEEQQQEGEEVSPGAGRWEDPQHCDFH